MTIPATDVTNPLLPAGYDIMWSLVLAVALALTVTALWQVLRSRELSGVQAVVWALLILALPVLGPIAWWILRPPRDARSADRASA
ncbi:PLDc N-terminal domain-containing protein [Agrococcus carbonis]|uniref:Phospholipase_D-nuclease N-terminal n=1 Tax=Agrococcus carbonis TaxID=684552 RepID=A0A1H1S5T5_9MICO|nr:PLDc N-terminal domain-containing protein [Agrococcus carbonis]SDS43365.1 Phospholipase_D-nuclease N-terminal [Agrococcus carbonis]